MTSDQVAVGLRKPRPDAPVLSVRDLRVRFATRAGPAHVVNGVSYDLRNGETLALVGESGCGKSVSVLALLGLLPTPPAQVTGSVRLRGDELIGAGRARLRRARGGEVGMVFQDPMTSLNPVLSIGRQLTEGMQVHLGLSRRAATARALELLDLVGIADPRRRLTEHPHQLSGGMRQRVMIAIALACNPKVLIADEATTALDVTVQAQIVELLARLRGEFGLAVVWITHDLGVVAGIADRVLVMYAGRVVESGPVDAVYDRPRHPYTRGLLASIPVLGEIREELPTIPGGPPAPTALPPGCGFFPRCPVRADPRCATEVPPLREVAPGHEVATFVVASGLSCG